MLQQTEYVISLQSATESGCCHWEQLQTEGREIWQATSEKVTFLLAQSPGYDDWSLQITKTTEGEPTMRFAGENSQSALTHALQGLAAAVRNRMAVNDDSVIREKS